MIICGERNIVVDVLICSDSVLRQFSDKELLVSQLCIYLMQFLKLLKLLSNVMSSLGSINVCVCVCVYMYVCVCVCLFK